MTVQVLINPVAGGARGDKLWRQLKPQLEHAFDDINVYFTQVDKSISQAAAKLVASQPQYFIIIGGDGTIHQVINGLMKSEKPLLSNTQLAFLNAGCGGDFMRQFPRQSIAEFIRRVKAGTSINFDLGKISMADSTRYFMNIASCGFSGYVAKKSYNSRVFKRFGGTVNYLTHTLLGLFQYKSQEVAIVIDDNKKVDYRLLLATVCNGQYFGGGMKISPQSDCRDGKLNLVLFKNLNRLTALSKLPLVYLGTHLKSRYVEQHWVEKVTLLPLTDQPVLIEADGECLGQLPATISVLKNKISIIV